MIHSLKKKRIETESMSALTRNHFTFISEYGDYSHLFVQKDFIVVNLNGQIDTVGVRLVKGELMVTSPLSEKRKLFGL
jgi:hypothetical protein